MSEGALEYTLIKETKVNVEISDVINELAQLVDEELDNYYLYQEDPYLTQDDSDEEVTVYLNKEGGDQGSPRDWRPLFTRAVKRLAQDIADGIEERGPVE